MALRDDGLCTAGRPLRNDDLVRVRAELLAPRDRDLVEAVVLRGQRVSSLARLMGVCPRSLRDRVHVLTQRMASRDFLDAARALPYLTNDDAFLARAAFCEGMPRRELCRRFGLTWHALRRRLDQLSARIAMIRELTERKARALVGANLP
jgi:hypothetical protein